MLLYIPIFFMVLKYMQTPNLRTLIDKLNKLNNKRLKILQINPS